MCKCRGVETTGAPDAGAPPKIFTCMCMLRSAHVIGFFKYAIGTSVCHRISTQTEAMTTEY